MERQGSDTANVGSRLLSLLGESLAEDETLQRALRILCEFVGAKYAAIGLVNYFGKFTRFIQHGFTAEQVADIGAPPQGVGLLGALFEGDETIRIDDLNEDRRHTGFPPHHPPMKTFLGTPMATQRRTYGRLYLAEKHDGETFTEEDATLVRGFARGLASILENIRLIEQLKRSETLFRAVLESASDAVLLIDQEMTVHFLNPSASAMFGYDPAEALRCDLGVLLDASSRETIAQRAAARTEGAFEAVGRHRDGTEFCTEVSIAHAIVSEEDMLVLILRDISERKELEQLRADFIAMLSHDIKGPLSVILGYTEMLHVDAQPRLNDDDMDLLNGIEQSTERIHHLVQNFVLTSRLDAGKHQVDLHPCDLNVVVKKATDFYRRIARSRDLRIELDFDSTSCVITGSPENLDRVFSNLLTNAIKHSPKGGSVRVAVRSADDTASVSICDQGKGIAPEDQPLLFQRYSRLSGVAHLGGTGLGLHIVKAITEAHGGQVEVWSSPGHGATFVVTLPRGTLTEGVQPKADHLSDPR